MDEARPKGMQTTMSVASTSVSNTDEFCRSASALHTTADNRRQRLAPLVSASRESWPQRHSVSCQLLGLAPIQSAVLRARTGACLEDRAYQTLALEARLHELLVDERHEIHILKPRDNRILAAGQPHANRILAAEQPRATRRRRRAFGRAQRNGWWRCWKALVRGRGAFDRGRMAWPSPRVRRHVGSAGRHGGGGDTVDGAFAASQSLTASHCSESAPWVERHRHRAVSEVACATLHVSSATPESRSNARSRPFASSMRAMTLWQFAIVFAASWTMSASRNVSSSENACGQKHRALAVQRCAALPTVLRNTRCCMGP